ncbi:hypothetical protein [Streptomyces sp. NPDC050704]|uniref:hypothetical protein n=1 Tax=Streptomyces sp. NPDC050704 TaxID=3157219 RepID=UPI003416DE4C
MRALVSRGLLLPPLVCAALAFGPVSAAAAVDVQPAVPGGHVAELSLSEADMMLERLDSLTAADHDDALAPLLHALTALAERGDGPLRAAEAAEHAKAVEEATTSVQQRLRAMDRAAPSSAAAAAAAAADPVSDVVAALQAAVGGLLSSLTSLDVGGVVAAVPKLLSTVVGLITGLLGGGLPALPVPLPSS